MGERTETNSAYDRKIRAVYGGRQKERGTQIRKLVKKVKIREAEY